MISIEWKLILVTKYLNGHIIYFRYDVINGDTVNEIQELNY